ncbi:MAG TPA: winged helix-turn-helix domain-containing protein [Caulobacteraceae bacterium]
MSLVSEADNHRGLGRVVLAHEEPVRIGVLVIDPARRRVAHDDGREDILEPRVMQVLVALIRAGGDILTRDELLASCWGGVIVGEDALSRVISRLRRMTEGVGEGALRLETITKVGYRLIRQGQPATSPPPTSPPASPGERPTLTRPTKPSIAVLPFRNVTGDQDKEYLADAITEDIVTALSRWRWFFVIARQSSFTYKNRDLDPGRIGDELGVRYILNGSVGAAGSRVRVNAHLIDAEDGANVWADKFDHELVDVLAMQDEITERVVGVIEPTMLRGEALRIARKALVDFSALDCVYRGMWNLNQLTPGSDIEALTLFRQAIALDPNLALGHVGAARILYGQTIYGEVEAPADQFKAALDLARTAIGLDAHEAQAHFAAAGPLLYLGEHAAAIAEARTAVALNSNFAYAHYRLGQALVFGGHPGEAVAPIERSLRLSPYDPQLGPVLETLALACYLTHDYEQAAHHAQSAGRISGSGAGVRAAALAQMGKADEAVRVLAGMDRYRPSVRRPLAAPYARPAHLEHLREGVRRARSFLPS